MNVKVIYSAGGKYNVQDQQQVAENETVVVAKKVAKALKQKGHSPRLMKITPSKIGAVKNIKADAVFNLCEWTGKDFPLGIEVLKSLEEKGIPYTGATSKSDYLSCDKITMKKMFDEFGIPTPAWTSVEPSETKTSIYEKIKKLKFPVIVKPAYEHCAIGINYKSVIKTKKDSVKKVLEMLKFYNEPILVEEFIDGREFTTTVLKNHIVHIFPPSEVIFNTTKPYKVLSFEAKWHSGKESYESKILEEKEVSDILKKVSKDVFTKMIQKGYARIDFRMRNKKAYVLEFNVNPSLLPEECYGLTVSTEAAGWDFNKLVDEIAHAAVTNFKN